MDTATNDTSAELVQLQLTQKRRHARQEFISGAFIITIAVLVGLLSLFNIYALNRLERQTAELRSTVMIKQRIEADETVRAAARDTKELADDMHDVLREAQAQIARTGLSAAQARTVRQDAHLYLIGASQRVPVLTRNAAAVIASGKRVRGLTNADATTLLAVRALRQADRRINDYIDPTKPEIAGMSFAQVTAAVPELQDAKAKLEALSKARPGAEAKTGMAQLYFIVAARLNYPAAMCDEIGALTSAATGAKPYPLKVVINNADCLRKNGKVKQANAEFAKAVAEYKKTDPDGANTPFLDYRALRGLATTAMALPDVANDAENKKRMQAAIEQLADAAKLSKANGEVPSQQQSIRGNMGIGFLRMGLYPKAIEHTKAIDAIYPGVWNLTVQAIAANKVGDSALERDAREKLRAFRRQQFNECELQLLLGPDLAPQLDPILKQAEMAEFQPVCPKVT